MCENAKFLNVQVSSSRAFEA